MRSCALRFAVAQGDLRRRCGGRHMRVAVLPVLAGRGAVPLGRHGRILNPHVVLLLPALKERARARRARPVRCDLWRLFWRPCGPWGALRRACRGMAVCAGAAAAGACGLPCRPSWPDGGRAFGAAWKKIRLRSHLLFSACFAAWCGVASLAAVNGGAAEGI